MSEFVSCGDGGEHQQGNMGGCDSWRCVCGNEPHLEGFYPCNERGEEVEPTPEAWKDATDVSESSNKRPERSLGDV